MSSLKEKLLKLREEHISSIKPSTYLPAHRALYNVNKLNIIREHHREQRKELKLNKQHNQIIRDNIDIKQLELDSLLSKLPKKKQQYFKLLFEIDYYENNPIIKRYNQLDKQISLVKDKDITIDKTEYKKMQELLTLYKQILNIKNTPISSISSISSSSSISPNYYEYKELKSSSPNDLIKKLRKIKIKQKTI